jgi:hypothetical protein
VTRSRASAKKAGASFESLIAAYLAAHVDDRIERRTKNGSKDRADVSGLRHMGQPIVIEVIEAKDHGGRLEVGPWLNETEVERLNDDAGVGLIIAKRRGYARPESQIVIMTLGDLISLLTGERPEAGRDG